MGDVDDHTKARRCPASPRRPAMDAPGERRTAGRVRLPDAGVELDADGPRTVDRLPPPGRERRGHVAVAADSTAPTSVGPRVSGAEPEPLPRQSSLGYQVNHLARLLAQALRRR